MGRQKNQKSTLCGQFSSNFFKTLWDLKFFYYNIGTHCGDSILLSLDSREYFKALGGKIFRRYPEEGKRRENRDTSRLAELLYVAI